jgi:hypothetical protein
MKKESDPILRKIKVRNWLVVGLFTAGSLAFQSFPITLGVFLGGCICSLNFHWMYSDARRALEGPAASASRRVVGRFYLRLLVTGIVILVIITQTPANIIALVVGLSIVVITIVPTVLLETQKKNSPRRLNSNDASIPVS